MFTHRNLIRELDERLDSQGDEPDKSECLRWKAHRVIGLPGACPLTIGRTTDGRNVYSLNVGECRYLGNRLKGGPNV
ncbi:MAG: hypothetical protein J0H98_10725 [Solirubrobacterales bacterium]|nr:hypothetical protein [Solirubrobacterales bacterium]